MKKSLSLLTSAVLAAFALSAPVAAEGWPSKPVRIVVPFAAGSTGEVVGRLIGEALEPELGQPVLIETHPGGAGNVGAAMVAHAKPDGHVLLLGATNNFVINQFLFEVPFDPIKDLEPITKVLDVPSVLISNPSVPAKTLKEFEVYAKANPGKLSYSSPGIGTTPHLGVEQLKQLTGIDLVHIPYGGGGPAVTGLLSDEVQLYMGGAVLVKPHVQAGKAIALAVGSDKRLDTMPDVPTTAEAGFAGYKPGNWWGIAAPKGTPGDVVERMHKLVAAALAKPELRARLSELGLVPIGNTPEEFGREIAEEAVLWSSTIEKGGIKVE